MLRRRNRLLRLGQICSLIAAFTCTTQVARAATIRFIDSTDTLDVLAGNRVTGELCISTITSEMCPGVLDHAPLNDRITTAANDLPDYTLIYEGRNIRTPLSDYLIRIDLAISETVSLNFTSDGTSDKALALPSGLGVNPNLTGCFAREVTVNNHTVRCMTETGLSQVVGTIAFQSPNGRITVDTVRIRSDKESPEPSSLLLLGSGVLGILGSSRRRLF